MTRRKRKERKKYVISRELRSFHERMYVRGQSFSLVILFIRALLQIPNEKGETTRVYEYSFSNTRGSLP